MRSEHASHTWTVSENWRLIDGLVEYIDGIVNGQRAGL